MFKVAMLRCEGVQGRLAKFGTGGRRDWLVQLVLEGWAVGTRGGFVQKQMKFASGPLWVQGVRLVPGKEG